MLLARAQPQRRSSPGAASSSRGCNLSRTVHCAVNRACVTVECWGGRQGGCGLELCVCRLRVCGSPLAVCLVSLFVSVCRSCVSSSSVQRPPIPRWCPVRAWLFFTFYLPTYRVGYVVSRSRHRPGIPEVRPFSFFTYLVASRTQNARPVWYGPTQPTSCEPRGCEGGCR